MDSQRALIFANGDLPDLAAARRLVRLEDTLIAADGGMRHLAALDLLPNWVIGDLDSLPPGRLEALQKAGVQFERHPAHKDETDLELAIGRAAALGFRQVVIVGALGGRLDQTLANLFLLTAPQVASLDLRLDDGHQEVFLITSTAEIHGHPGEVVSLLPLGREAREVTTAGLEYPLNGETLYPFRTRGVSNVMLGDRASVSLASGQLLCIHTRDNL